MSCMAALEPEQSEIRPLPRRAALSAPLAALLPVKLGDQAPSGRQPRPAPPPTANAALTARPPEPPPA